MSPGLCTLCIDFTPDQRPNIVPLFGETSYIGQMSAETGHLEARWTGNGGFQKSEAAWTKKLKLVFAWVARFRMGSSFSRGFCKLRE